MGNIEIEILEEPNVETEVLDLNYIPDYQVYEQQRQANEVIRQDNEATRKSNETTRQNNETGRTTAEGLRVNAESGRVDAESLRVTAEQGRVDAEALRVQAENGRVLAEEAREAVINSLATVATTGSYSDLIDEPTKVSDFTNDLGFVDKNVNNLTYYTLATGTGSSIELGINQSTYVVTLNLKNSAGTTISTGSIDLPLESVVVGGYYDAATKKVILTLQNGNTISFSVADLVSGLQSEINIDNKLSSDLVDDTDHTHKFVTSSDKTTWNAKYDKPGTGIPKSDLSSGVQASLDKADSAIQDISGKEDKSNKVTTLSGSSTHTQYPSAKCVYDALQTKVEDVQLDGTSIVNNGVANALTTGYTTENKLITQKDYDRAMSIYNVLPKVNGTGENISLDNTGVAPLNMELNGNTYQETTTISGGDEYDSPSPDHPQPIQVVSGDNEVSVCGKNLFDINSIGGTTSGCSKTIVDNNLILTSTSKTTGYCIHRSYNLKPNTQYTLSYSATTDYYAGYQIRSYRKDGTYVSIKGLTQGTNVEQTFTTPSDIYRLVLYFYCSNGTNVTIGDKTTYTKIQLEEGNATTYKPYQSQTYPINLGVENLININNSENGGIDTSGNYNTGANLWRTTEYIKVKPNTSYTISRKTFNDSLPRVMRLYEYDSNQTFISPRVESNTSTLTITTGANTEYLKWTIFQSDITFTLDIVKNWELQLEQGSRANSYTPYSTTPIELCKIGTYQDKFIRNSGKNLFDKDNATRIDAYVSETSWVYSSIAYSYKIPCKPNTKYTISANNFQETIFRAGITDSNNIPITDNDVPLYSISRYTNTNTPIYLTSGANAKYIVFQLSSAQYENTLKTIMINEGTTALPYQPYGKGEWLLEKNIGKYVYNNDLTENGITTNKVGMITPVLNIEANIVGLTNKSLCNIFTNTVSNNTGMAGTTPSKRIRLDMSTSIVSDFTEFRNICNTKQLTIYYGVETPTYTKIEGTLASQLDAIEYAMSYQTQTNISQINNDLPFIIDAETLRDISNLENRVTLLED